MIKANIKPGYKKTSVGIIPEDWKVKRIKNLLEDSYLGGNYKNNLEKEFNNNQIPLIKMGNIGRGQIDLDQFYSIDEKEGLKSKHLLQRNDILFNTRNTLELVGKVAIWKNEYPRAYFNSNLLKLQFKKTEIKSLDFINFQLNSYLALKSLRAVATGTTSVAAIYDKDLKKIKLPIPPLPEQEAIADCLSTWDKGIEKLSALIASKKEQKKGLMQGLFSGKKRLDGFTEEWKTKRLNVIGKVNYGTRIVKGNVEEGEYFVYGGGGKTFTNKEYNREDRMIIARFAMSKECARFVKGKFYLNDSGLTVDANEKTNQSFLDYLLFFNQHNIYKLRAGGAQQNLDVQAFRGISLSIPSIEEQTAIAEVLTTADKEIELLEKKLEAFKIQKKGLMQVLLTGERRLVDS